MRESGGRMHKIAWTFVTLAWGAAALALDKPTTAPATPHPPEGLGLSAKYPADAGIASDPAVFFADDFESGDLKKWDDRSGTIAVTADDKPHAGKRCAVAEMHRGKDHGGEAKK